MNLNYELTICEKSGIDKKAYVSRILLKGCRSVLANLRCGILPLGIETVRYDAVAQDNRSCKICSEINWRMSLCVHVTLTATCDSVDINIGSVCPQFQGLTSNEKFLSIVNYCRKTAAKYATAAFKRQKDMYQWLLVTACPLFWIILFDVIHMS